MQQTKTARFSEGEDEHTGICKHSNKVCVLGGLDVLSPTRLSESEEEPLNGGLQSGMRLFSCLQLCSGEVTVILKGACFC